MSNAIYTEMAETTSLRTPCPLPAGFQDASLTKKIYAEFFGSMVYFVIGYGAFIQSFFIFQDSSIATKRVSYTSILQSNVGLGLGVALGMMLSRQVSGGHLNPVVSTLFAILGKLSWEHLVWYMIAQFCGAFTGALFLYLAYYPAFHHIGLFDHTTAAGFASYTQKYETAGAAFLYVLLGTSVFIILILGLQDSQMRKIRALRRSLHPYIMPHPIKVALIYIAIGLSWAYSVTFAYNPAADFAGRLFSAMSGWGRDVFVYDHYYFWIPLIAPFTAVIVVGIIYMMFTDNGDMISI